MRIVAGAWRGRRLLAPLDAATRPTADRVRQALFDMLLHAPWGGRAAIDGALVLDAFAGTGALGLEALSRGAAHATFIERDGAALAALRTNIAACGATDRARVIAGDALVPPRAPAGCGLVFLDPPYERALPAGRDGSCSPYGRRSKGEVSITAILAGLRSAGWIAPNALIVAETARDAPNPAGIEPLAARTHGLARIMIWRFA
jgi:16S rRNA (guanine966-N2)-methyltransferase